MGARDNTFQTTIAPNKKERLVIQAIKLKKSENIINIKFDIEPILISKMKEKKYIMKFIPILYYLEVNV